MQTHPHPDPPPPGSSPGQALKGRELLTFSPFKGEIERGMGKEWHIG